MKGARKVTRVSTNEVHMSNIESKFSEADLLMTYSKAALKKAHLKYSFDFSIAGAACRTWYDPEKDGAYFDCGDGGESLFQLTREIERAIEECGSKSDIDILDLRKFVFKHVQAMIRVEKELQRTPASERHWKVLDAKPIDLEKLSLEKQCLLEVLHEQVEKAESEGTVGDGYTITKEMVDAKMREKLETK
jgi:hypothetical protein